MVSCCPNNFPSQPAISGSGSISSFRSHFSHFGFPSTNLANKEPLQKKVSQLKILHMGYHYHKIQQLAPRMCLWCCESPNFNLVHIRPPRKEAKKRHDSLLLTLHK
jgi:hypothetical protein